MATPYEQREQFINTLSGGKGYASLTEQQKATANALGGKEPIIISTKQADKKIEEARETQNRLAPPPVAPTEPTKPAEPTKTEPTKPTGISFSDLTASGSNYADYDRQADGSYLPRPKTAEEIQLATEKTQAETAKAELESEKDRLRNLDISQDPTFQRISAGISSQWDARVADMERANASRKASLTQTGMRVGGRYTTSFEGVITAEEREGISRIGDLQSQKQSALVQAESAYRDQKWTEYSKFVDLAEKKYESEQEEFDALNKIVMEENKKRTDAMNAEAKKTQLGDAVYNAYAGGMTDTAQIYAELRNKGIAATPEEVGDILDEITPKEEKLNLRSLKGGLYDVENDKWIIEPTEKTGVVNKITWSEATKRGLPLTMVGMSEVDIVNQLNSNIVPVWFRVEKEKEEQMSFRPDILQQLWNEFRMSILGGASETTTDTDTTDEAPY